MNNAIQFNGARPIIDFNKIDQKKVLVLAKHPEALSALVDFLGGKSFEVNVQKVPGDFFQSISQFKPGFVMISNEMNMKMGKVFPHFIQKKFNIPVLLFPEMTDKSSVSVVEDAAKLESAAVRSLKSIEQDYVLSEIEQFEGRYKAQVSALQKTDQLNFDQLKKARHKRQTAVFNKLSEKIRVGLPLLMKKEELQMVSIKIADPSGQGSFLVFTELPINKPLAELEKDLTAEIEGPDGQTLHIEKLDFKIPNEVVLQLKSNSDKAVHGHWGDIPVSIFYFMDSDVKSHENLTPVDGGYLIPVEAWWSRLPLIFDAYIYLKHNSKVLLYVHSGSFFPQSQLENLMTRKQNLWVKGDDFHRFELMSELVGLLENEKSVIAIAA